MNDAAMCLALIHNPRSCKNLRNDGKFAAEAAQILGERFLVPASHVEMAEMVEQLAGRNVRLIAIDGGDGTACDVMTAIARAYPENSLPELAIFPSGNTNLIAHDVGFSTRGIDALKKLVRDNEVLPRTRRRPLRVSWPDDEQEPRLGMFQGSAGYARAIAIAHSPLVSRHASHNLAVSLTLVVAFCSLLRRKQREVWFKGDRLTVESEGRTLADGFSFLFLSTALQKLNLGIWPFWSSKTVKSGGLHYLHVADHPKRLIRASWALLRGKAPPWLQVSSDYTSGRAAEMTLTCEGDFFLDGERFSPGAGRRIFLTEGPEFVFIHD